MGMDCGLLLDWYDRVGMQWIRVGFRKGEAGFLLPIWIVMNSC